MPTPQPLLFLTRRNMGWDPYLRLPFASPEQQWPGSEVEEEKRHSTPELCLPSRVQTPQR